MAHQPAKPQIHAHPLVLLLWVLLVFPLCLSAQENMELSTRSKKAAKAYQEAEQNYRSNDYGSAEKRLQKALSFDPQFIEAWLMLGDVQIETQQADQAMRSFEAALAIDTLFYPPAAFILAKLYLDAGQNAKAATLMKQMLTKNELRPELQLLMLERYQTAVFRQKAIENPVSYEPESLGEQVNSVADEYVNAVRLDGQLLLFTRRSVDTASNRETWLSEQLFQASRNENGWDTAVLMPLDWPMTDQVGAMQLSANGRKLYFAACSWPDGLGSCDLFESDWENGKWVEPQSLGTAINTAAWESQPTVSADEQTLIFSSNRKGGLGGSDLYKSIRLTDGSWSKPINLGEQINSPQNEMAPFLHPDGKTLYFSSDRPISMGGYDLYISRMDEAGRWQKAVNLGYPINTSNDEMNLIVTPDGQTAYLSAKLKTGAGGFDIYAFPLDEKLRPEPATYLQFVVRDSLTKMPLSAKISLLDPSTAQTVFETNAGLTDGEAISVVPSRQQYALQVSKDAYLFYDDYIAADSGTELKPRMVEVLLKPIEKGKTTVLGNIHFALNKAELRPDAYAGLQLLWKFLNSNPTVTVTLEGHTDNTGSDNFNNKLSADRAKAVRRYLIEKGIDSQRIRAIGFGASKPIAPNETETGRALNRRTEMRIDEIVTQKQ